MPPLHNAKILIVDDEKLTCSLLREFLEIQYHVEVAFNGVEALQKTKEFQPDCILLDIRMPDMDGVKALKSINPGQSGVKVIMITVIGCADIAKECLKLGAFDYITKPLDLDALENQIRAALADSKQIS